MKTRSIVLTAAAWVMVIAGAFATVPGKSTVVVVNQKEAGVYKVIYEGSKAGKVNFQILDQNGNVLFAEVIRGVNGFIRPVNFSGMNAGTYTIEISDDNGKDIQKIEYNTDTVLKNVHVTRTTEAGKYLFTASNKSAEEVNVKIFDGLSNLLYSETLTIKGDFGLVYNLNQVSGKPSFELSDNKGNVRVIK